MDSSYIDLRSSNMFVELFKELMPLVITLVLIYLYYKRRITVVDMLLYAFATETYTVLYIGPTFNSTLFISLFISLDQLHQLLTGKLYIRSSYMILLLPLLSHLAVLFIVQMFDDAFSYADTPLAFYMRPVYFYLKTYLPMFAIGSKILQDRDSLSFEGFLATLKRIAIASCWIATAQLVVLLVFNNNILGQLMGLQERYMIMSINGPLGTRVQALFGEPKVFCALISLVIPVFIRDKQYWYALWALVMAALTSSQTLWTNLISAGIVFLLLNRIQLIRAKVLLGLAAIVCIFMLITSARDVLAKHYMENSSNPVYRLLLERSLSRYDTQYWQQDNVYLGIPLQRDMELPVVNFLTDHPYLLLTGYGPGNSKFIPSGYFDGLFKYRQMEGVGGHNLNMRWFYILAEFGVFGLIYIFLLVTRTAPGLPAFQRNYMAFICVCFFFSQIDLFLVITSLLCLSEDTVPVNEALLVNA